ncbi:MAG: PQQ-binding-like beta-propeller repeat protein, partial [Bryobacteraceae bacterium]
RVWWTRGLTWQPKSSPVIGDGVLYFNGWAPGGDPGQQYELPTFAEALKAADANADGRLAQPELPKPWQPTGSWGAIDLDDDGLLNERDWGFFRARRAARNGLLAVRLGGRGDVTNTHVLWRYDKALPDVPCPLLYRGVLYLVRSGGIATSLDARTGQVLKQQRLPELSDYYSSPIAAGDYVYMISQTGKASVLTAAGDWQVVAVNDLEEETNATPAIADGRLYLRTRGFLYCFGDPAARAAR